METMPGIWRARVTTFGFPRSSSLTSCWKDCAGLGAGLALPRANEPITSREQRQQRPGRTLGHNTVEFAHSHARALDLRPRCPPQQPCKSSIPSPVALLESQKRGQLRRSLSQDAIWPFSWHQTHRPVRKPKLRAAQGADRLHPTFDLRGLQVPFDEV